MKKSEHDCSRYDWSKAKRGRHLARARRSFAPVLLDPEIVACFENAEAINAALRVIVDAARLLKRPRPKRPRSARRRVS